MFICLYVHVLACMKLFVDSFVSALPCAINISLDGDMWNM